MERRVSASWKIWPMIFRTSGSGSFHPLPLHALDVADGRPADRVALPGLGDTRGAELPDTVGVVEPGEQSLNDPEEEFRVIVRRHVVELVLGVDEDLCPTRDIDEADVVGHIAYAASQGLREVHDNMRRRPHERREERPCWSRSHSPGTKTAPRKGGIRREQPVGFGFQPLVLHPGFDHEPPRSPLVRCRA
jgi:hypothetical protein